MTFRSTVTEISDSRNGQEYISDAFKELGKWKVETAEESTPYIVRQPLQIQSAPLWRLSTGTKKFYTPKPISVKIYRDGAFFFAENEALVLCGTGNTPGDALKDLTQHIIYFFNYYQNLNELQLIGDAIRLKNIYTNLLVEE
ncbi:MAG: hypothetical protein V1709_05095 [Planctomycetota bacterium]